MKKKYISIFTVIVFLFTTLFSIGRPVGKIFLKDARHFRFLVAYGRNLLAEGLFLKASKALTPKSIPNGYLT